MRRKPINVSAALYDRIAAAARATGETPAAYAERMLSAVLTAQDIGGVMQRLQTALRGMPPRGGS